MELCGEYLNHGSSQMLASSNMWLTLFALEFLLARIYKFLEVFNPFCHEMLTRNLSLKKDTDIELDNMGILLYM